MTRIIKEGTKVKVTGDTGDYGPYVNEGDECTVIMHDDSDNTYLLNVDKGYRGYIAQWVASQDVEIVE